MRGYALVLAYDLSSDGKTVGPGTIERLKAGADYAARHNYKIITTAAKPPQSDDEQTMSEMMSDWLSDNNFLGSDALVAEEFNSRGEVLKFMKLSKPCAMVSAPWHLARLRLIVLLYFGLSKMHSIEFVPAFGTHGTLKERYILEPLKCLNEIRKRLVWKQ